MKHLLTISYRVNEYHATFVAILLFAAATQCHAATVKRIYWSDSSTNKIQSADLDGANVQDIVTNPPGFAYSLVVNPLASKLYWTNFPPSIKRSNYDGSVAETVIDSAYSGSASFMALDTDAGNMYWTDTLDNNIRRSKLDGSNVQVIQTSTPNPKGIALDLGAGSMYWTESTGGQRIRKANLDGSNVQTLVTGLQQPGGIALDVAAGKMYFTEELGETISRANLDGTNREIILGPSKVDFPAQIALDISGGKIYWTEAAYTSGLVRCANLDGSNIQNLYHGVNPVGIVVITIPEPTSMSIFVGCIACGAFVARRRSTPRATGSAHLY